MRRDDTDIFGYNLGGSVGDYFDDGLQPIMRPEKPELPSKAQVAAVGAGILGGTPYGLIDIFGGAPEIPADPNTTVGEMFVGPRSPSMAEYIRQGSIVDPLLQLAGVVPFAAAATMPIRRARALSQLELPTDTASRMSRAESGGYNTDVYHGSTHDVYAFDAENASDMSDFGRGVYLTNNPQDASTNYAGVGPDLQTRIDQATEYHTEVSGMAPDLAEIQARKELIGEASGGVVYPLKLNTENFVTVGGRDGTVIPAGSDYRQSAIDDIDSYDGGRKAFDSDDAYEDAVYDRANEFYDTDIDSNYLKLKDFLSGLGADERLTSDILLDVFDGSGGLDEINATQLVDAFNKNYLMDGRRTPSAMAAEFFKDELNYEGIIDRNVNKKFSMQGMDDETEHYIVFGGSENKIRSPQAQFDPSQKDSADILRAGGGEVDKQDIFGYNLGGSVGQYFDEYGNPVTPEITQETPLTPAQTANVLGGLAPGAGLLDISGLYSAFPTEDMTTAEMLVGERSPSLAENIRNAEVIDSGLQILGGIGDLIPPVAAAIAPLRAARAAKRLKTYAPRSDEGFYSAAEEAALNLKRKEGSGQAFINDLQKSGVKPDELRASGFIDIFSEKPDVTRDDVADYFQSKEPIIKTQTISDKIQQTRNVTDNEIVDYILDDANIDSSEWLDSVNKTITDYDILQGGNLQSKSPQEKDQIVNNYRALLDNYRVYAQEAAQVRQERLQRTPEHKGYTLDEGRSGDNYKETLIKLSEDTSNTEIVNGLRREYGEISARLNRDNPDVNDLQRMQDIKDALPALEVRYGGFTGGHYDDPNVLAHLRTMDRVDTDGKKVLLIEEIQSDWHKQGAERGYLTEDKINEKYKVKRELEEATAKYKKIEDENILIDLGLEGYQGMSRNPQDALEEQIKVLQNSLVKMREAEIYTPPDAPFKTGDKSSWYNLTLKKALQDAVAGGYDKLALTTGRQQADRYNQTKNVSSLRYQEKFVDGRPVNTLTAYDLDGRRVLNKRINDPEKDISEIIGKDAAKKLLDQDVISAPLNRSQLAEYDRLERAIPNLSEQEAERYDFLNQKHLDNSYDPNTRALDELDLEVGGEGMRQFYDKTYVNALNKLVKPDGVKVGKTKLTSKRTRRAISEAEKEELLALDELVLAYDIPNSTLTEAQLERFELLNKKDNTLEYDEDTVHSVDITPEMRKRVQMGLELFGGGGEVDKRSEKDKLRELIELMKGNNLGGSVDKIDIFGYNLGGSVSDLIKDPSMSNLQREAPSLSPAQAANIGGGFLPYSGMADIFGEYAAFPTDPDMTTAEMIVGPRGPSLAENIRNREIIDSGLQIAGGIGDLFPPLMAAVAPMRVARAAAKAATKAKKIDFDFPITHRGPEKVTSISDDGVFSGIFGSAGETSRGGYGDVETTFYPRKGRVAGDGDRDLDYEKTIKFLQNEFPDADKELIQNIYEITADDSNVFNMKVNPLAEYGFTDLGDASWEAQKIRGKIAADQGFDAIAMSDETGTSYLLPYGSKASSVEETFPQDAKAKGISSLSRPSLSDFQKSQQPSKKLKSLKSNSPIKELRKEIAEKRKERALRKRKSTLPIEFRLKNFKDKKSQNLFKEKILDHPNAQYWGKQDTDLIKKELDLGREYSNHANKIKKANLKATVNALKKNGFEVDYTSKNNGLVSSYYMTKDGVRYRISDHELPETPERLSNRKSGLGGNWDDEIVIDANTSIESALEDILTPKAKKIAELREEANRLRFGDDYADTAAAKIDTSYRGGHQPYKGADSETIRLDDLTRSIDGENAGYPDDFYTPTGKRLYAPGPRFEGDEFGKANSESYSVIKSVKGKPEDKVKIYRAVPKGIKKINEGDFVTLSPTYADLHGSGGYGPSGDDVGDIISSEVRVKDLIWDGNDPNEFGYFPADILKAAGGIVSLDDIDIFG